MRQAFHIAVIALLGFLISHRALMHAQAGEPGTISCAQGADLVKADAMRKGFSEAGSVSQSQAFLSRCLVSGQGSVGNRRARD